MSGLGCGNPPLDTGRTRLNSRPSLRPVCALSSPAALLLGLLRLRWEEPSWLVTEEVEEGPFLLRGAERPPALDATGLEAAVLEGDMLLSSAASDAVSVCLTTSGGGVADVREEAPLEATSPKMRARAALYEASRSSSVMSLRVFALSVSLSVLSTDRRGDCRLLDGSRRMILKPDFGVLDGVAKSVAGVGAGDPGEDVDGDDSDEPAR